MIYQKSKNIFIFTFAILLLTGCTTSNQSVSMLNENYIPEKDEKRLIKRASELSKSINENENTFQKPSINDYPNSVLKRLLEDDSLALTDDIEFKVTIIKNPYLNAFALANGSIYIHSGILAKMENEAQLAMLIGHEMSHVIYKHGIKRSRNHKNSALAATIFGTLTLPFDFGLVSALLYNASLSGYSQANENEADKEGITQMVNAGYDVQEGARLFNILLKDIQLNEIKQPFFFSTHPKVQNRIDNCATIIEKSHAHKKGRIGKETFEQYVKPLLQENIMADLKLRRFKSAKASIEVYLKRYPKEAYGYYALGELHRLNTEKKDTQVALDNYNLSIEKEHDFSLAYRGIAYVYLKQQQKAKAKEYFEKYLSFNTQATDKKYILKYIQLCDKNEGKEYDKISTNKQ
jgi:predicted Zn-dependent protease